MNKEDHAAEAERRAQVIEEMDYTDKLALSLFTAMCIKAGMPANTQTAITMANLCYDSAIAFVTVRTNSRQNALNTAGVSPETVGVYGLPFNQEIFCYRCGNKFVTAVDSDNRLCPTCLKR